MPTYEYKCAACDHVFERFQSITAAPIRKCPACGKNKVKRLLGVGAGLIFKGSGFYITDYRSEGYKSAAKADTPESTKPASDGAKPETKPAAQPAAESAKPAPSKSKGPSTKSKKS